MWMGPEEEWEGSEFSAEKKQSSDSFKYRPKGKGRCLGDSLGDAFRVVHPKKM